MYLLGNILFVLLDWYTSVIDSYQKIMEIKATLQKNMAKREITLNMLMGCPSKVSHSWSGKSLVSSYSGLELILSQCPPSLSSQKYLLKIGKKGDRFGNNHPIPPGNFPSVKGAVTTSHLWYVRQFWWGEVLIVKYA